MVYAHALGACGETLGGSSPLPPILLRSNTFVFELRRNVEKQNAPTKPKVKALWQSRVKVNICGGRDLS